MIKILCCAAIEYMYLEDKIIAGAWITCIRIVYVKINEIQQGHFKVAPNWLPGMKIIINWHKF